MNKYVMNEESNELFSSMHDKFEEIESSHGTISDEIDSAISSAEDAHNSAEEAKDSLTIAMAELHELRTAFKLIRLDVHEEESEVDKLVKLTGKSIEELKHILRYE
tara:strand:- start:430 stop:747 length:318 start_codon:yes stop_codon:yes gene_type:complete